jgi:hypothetical protein
MKKRALLLFLLMLVMLPIQVLSAEMRYSIPLEDSPSRGPEDAPVTIVEFIDFQ